MLFTQPAEGVEARLIGGHQINRGAFAGLINRLDEVAEQVMSDLAESARVAV